MLDIESILQQPLTRRWMLYSLPRHTHDSVAFLSSNTLYDSSVLYRKWQWVCVHRAVQKMTMSLRSMCIIWGSIDA